MRWAGIGRRSCDEGRQVCDPVCNGLRLYGEGSGTEREGIRGRRACQRAQARASEGGAAYPTVKGKAKRVVLRSKKENPMV